MIKLQLDFHPMVHFMSETHISNTITAKATYESVACLVKVNRHKPRSVALLCACASVCKAAPHDTLDITLAT